MVNSLYNAALVCDSVMQDENQISLHICGREGKQINTWIDFKKTDGIQRVLLDEKGKKVDWEYLNTVGTYILHFKCWQALGTKNKIVICEILSQDTERTVE